MVGIDNDLPARFPGPLLWQRWSRPLRIQIGEYSLVRATGLLRQRREAFSDRLAVGNGIFVRGILGRCEVGIEMELIVRTERGEWRSFAPLPADPQAVTLIQKLLVCPADCVFAQNELQLATS